MYHAFLLLLLALPSLLFAQTTNHTRLQSIQELKRIAFGSCSNQNHTKQPLWQVMLKNKPDIFVWGGDNIYADWGKMDSVERAYKKQNGNPDYQALKAEVPVIGTWDDHDYAFNNAGGNVSFKKESQRLHLDFMEVPQDSPRRLQEGIYTTYEYGPVGRRVKLIMLDQRYFKGLNATAPLLGEVQWAWLENEFKMNSADLHIVFNGLPIFGPLIPYTEEWGEYPKEQNRLLNLIKTHKPKGLMFATGDKHFSSIYKMWGQLEFMSSGMTHTAPRKVWWYLARKYPNTYFGFSYGEINISWEESTPLLTLLVRNVNGAEINKRKFRWKVDQWVLQ